MQEEITPKPYKFFIGLGWVLIIFGFCGFCAATKKPAMQETMNTLVVGTVILVTTKSVYWWRRG